jgi:hypothetical protein
MHSLVIALNRLRAPFSIALATALVLALPSQSREILGAVWAGSGLPLVAEAGRALVALLIFAATLLGCALILLQTAPEYREAAVKRHWRLLEAVALGVALIPILIVVLVTIAVLFLSPEPTERPTWVGRREIPVAIAFALFAGCVALLWYLDKFRAMLATRFLRLYSSLAGLTLTQGLLIVGFIVVGVSTVIFFYPKQFASAFGPICVLFLFLGLVCIATSLLTHVYDRYQIPCVMILTAIAILWSLLGTNNNHHLRVLKEPETELAKPSDAFQKWLAARPDLADYKGRTYPVYVVAAEGGGVYAATHAAWTLARIQDSCPAFAQHVFALSGVSGGSLGAALFAALVKAQPPPRSLPKEQRCPLQTRDGPMQNAVREYFKQDLLTPLLAAGLFPDFLQWFWPTPIDPLDRARALETTYEETWADVMRQAGRAGAEGIFRENVRQLWDAQADTPALLLNGTLVQGGGRAILSPLALADGKGFSDRAIDRFSVLPLSLSTAAGVSARFPFVTPAALYRDKEKELAWQIVDGGYYENSGIQTAVNLIEALQRPKDGKPLPTNADSDGGACRSANRATVTVESVGAVMVCFRIIIVKRASFPDDKALRGEVMAPLTAVIEARRARSKASAHWVYNAYCGSDDCGLGRAASSPHVYVSYIDSRLLPLGWYLSSRSLQLATPAWNHLPDCSRHGPGHQTTGDESIKEELGCLFTRISNDINGR